MKEPASFSSEDKEKTSLNFSELREKGLAYVQERSGNLWTDYNTHDPGVTILEQLCYAVTDVSLRSTYPIKDLLTEINADREAQINAAKNSFHAPSHIYRTHPITVIDAKKAIIDAFDVIENVWITPMDNSDYAEKIVITKNIEIQPKSIFNNKLIGKTPEKEQFLKDLQVFINANRSLGEDILNISLLEPKPTTIDFKVHIMPHKSVEKALAKVLMQLFEYVYNPVSKLALDDMLTDNTTVSDVFSGPRLTKGFIKDKSLKSRRTSLTKLELQQELSKVEAVLKVEVLNIQVEYLKSGASHFFHLLDETEGNIMSPSRFSRVFENMGVVINEKAVELSEWSKTKIHETFHELWAKKYRQYAINFNQNFEYTKSLKGTKRDVETYYSLQNQFPLIYGIGNAGLSHSNQPSRHAKAKQLKGYLLFFEQYLANHLSQINRIADFFNKDLVFNNKEKTTYYSQSLSNVPAIEALSPNPVFKVDACVYYSEKNEQRLYVEATIDSENLCDLSEVKQQILLERIIVERPLFKKYLAKARGVNMPSELGFGSTEVRAFLSMLYGLKFKWFEEEVDTFFGKSVVLSFAMLMKYERKHFTPMVFVEAFQNHLKRMLAAIERQSLFPLVFEKLNEIDLDKVENKVVFQGFLKLYQDVINVKQDATYFDRKSRVFNHLLARFGEDLNAIPWNVSRRLDIIKSEAELQTILLEKKSAYLNNIESLTADTAKGETFISGQPERNPSGLENTIIAKTGILPRLTRTIKSQGTLSENDETFYVVDHILLRTFVTHSESKYGFKFVDPSKKYIGGTILKASWSDTETDREASIEKFFENDKKDPEETGLTFPGLHNIGEVTDLVKLFQKSSEENNRVRLREVEKIRAKGLAKVKRGEYGQRRLVYQRKLTNLLPSNQELIVDEDFFNLSISVVLPKTSERFKDNQFKSYINGLIVERTPSHIKVNVLYVNAADMHAFQTVYHEWENLKTEETKSGDTLKMASYKVYKKIIEFTNKQNCEK
ncbi:hypothetical protein ACFFU1_17820 [Algibacter miyuki]|uniref:Uncharacterized protein n=1 Tax=Algibacter miyuki TaxID=1306933 RepID=A0ABV5H4S9_9FLAO|nr:hypothetical protein [Algibacter miyuki]MDN3663823.1 hypothetical protein [Algibacter miyuki]